MRQIPLGVRLPDRASFASFLPEGNVQAVQHLQAVARGERRGLTWLCGAAGCGKSHLLQAVCAAAAPQRRAGYVPLADVAPLGVGMLEGLRELECVGLDDVERVVGDASWERGLFGLLREMEEAGGALLMAAPAPPALLPWSLPDLGSRCAAGTVCALRPLDESGQRAALTLRARLRGLELPEETWEWLRRRVPRDMATLYGVLDTLDEAALSAQRRLTVPFIRDVLRAARRGGD